MSNNIKVCVVGWHFMSDFYKKLRKCHYDSHIVAHRYNKILDELNFDYSIINNIGLEYGAYSWYIKNMWDGESGVLFSHDDVFVTDPFVLNSMIDNCKKYDRVNITGKNRAKKQRYSTRCVYLSGRLIKQYIKEFGGVWYDRYNKGYTLCQKIAHDDLYDNKNDAASKFKVSLNYLCKKYNFNIFDYNNDNLVFYRRGSKKKCDKTLFNDNSIFGRDPNNPLEELAIKYKVDSRRDCNFYTKWYHFYFNSLRFDNLNILNIGEDNEKSVEMWKRYFKNSTIYSDFSIKPKNGFDIIIDKGNGDNRNMEVFKQLFKNLNFSGIYSIENIQIFYENGEPNRFIDFFKKRVDDINFCGKYNINNIEKLYNKNMKLNYYEENISSICFHSGICFIFKR